ncbi:unnamed protein product [Ranitomeya imitator]|uniref:Pre-mRNA-splicing factor SLU7 n=1 Tax=Ranitomeya imitator TaxID=111125 RepID=A0ABN9L9V6_9NEOB|nr:unnamed protein product [Ranitomeya imitator]
MEDAARAEGQESAALNKHVKVFSDNTTTVAFLRHQGGPRHPALQDLAEWIFKWAEKSVLSITAIHLEGSKNQLADFLSRKSERDRNSEDEDEDKYADDIDMPGQNFDSKRRITVRNLRIREDTAKYLRNLNPNSAYYDPKTRAMRENPYADAGKNADEVSYAGDNFVRYTGDTISMAQTQLFAWEAYEKGSDVHLQADPTKLEVLSKSFKVKKEDFKEEQKKSILERCIWGSFWKDGRWGYKCCHSFVKMSYCTGEAGKSTNNTDLCEEELEAEEMSKPKTLVEIHQEKMKKKKKKHRKSGGSDSEGEERKKQEKLKKLVALETDHCCLTAEQAQFLQASFALNAEEARLKHVKELLQIDERKRAYNSIYETREPTEEEMEAYRMKRQRPDDPMASFLQ